MKPPTKKAGMLSTGDVGRALGVSINTVKSWVRTGKIAAVRLPSGHYRIPRGELDRLLLGGGGTSGRWHEYERWRRGQGTEELDIDRTLEWIDSMLRLARSQGPLPDEPLEEKAAGVRRMHRALASVPK
jgi:excisionase family DNA binding protein